MLYQSPPISEAPILVALDLGEHCQECLERAWHVAAQREQTLIIVHIAHETAQTAGMYQRRNRGNFTLPITDIAKNLLADFVAEFSRTSPEFRNIDSRQVVVSGVPQTRIPELAKRYHAGAIVMSSPQQSGFLSLLQHSVGRAVVNAAHCPVFLLDGSDEPITAAPTPVPRQESVLRSMLSHVTVRHHGA